MKGSLGNAGKLMMLVLCMLILVSSFPRVQGSTDVPELRATLQDEGILLDWNAPIKSGVTGYVIYRGFGEDQRHLYMEFKSDVTSHTDTDVEEGRTYYYWITALFGSTESPCSPAETVTFGERNIPTPPRDLKVHPGDSTVVLTWQSPLDNGNRQITNYRIFRSKDGGEYQQVFTSGTVLEYRDTSLQNGVSYRYMVKAKNIVGMSEGVESREVKPSENLEVPGTPRNVRCFSGKDFVQLIWDEPEDDGGTPAFLYNVYRDGEFLVDVRERYYVDEDVFSSAIYSVRAVNAVGEGKESISVNGEVSGIVPETTISLEHSVRDGSIRLKWDEVGQATGFIIYRGVDPENLYPYHMTEKNDFTDSDTEVDRRYYYRVAALEDRALVDGSEVIGVTSLEVSRDDSSLDLSRILNILLISLVIGGVAAAILFFVHRRKPKGPQEPIV